MPPDRKEAVHTSAKCVVNKKRSVRSLSAGSSLVNTRYKHDGTRQVQHPLRRPRLSGEAARDSDFAVLLHIASALRVRYRAFFF